MKKALRYFISSLFIVVSLYFIIGAVQVENNELIARTDEGEQSSLTTNINSNRKVVSNRPTDDEKEKNTKELSANSNTTNNFKFSIGGILNNKNIDDADLFKYIIEKIKLDYVEEVEEKKLYEDALRGMLSSLDPHSMYMSEKEFKEMQLHTKGEFGGLGVVVTKDGNFIKVVSPIDGTPAAKAGMLSGDYISEINGVDTFDMTLFEAVERMRGKVGEKIKIVVLRKGESKPLEFNLRREIIKIDSVKGEIKKDNIIYIKISSFIETTQHDTIALYNKLKNQIEGEVKGFILDLRSNPGGLLDQSVKISELFLDGDKLVVSTRGREAKNGKESQYFEKYKTTNKTSLIKNIPVVVLVNEGSASASEIVAGALQDYKVAIVMGEKTFGKASVQQVIPLANGGAIKMTIARYYTPLGRSIQVDGITPDIIVKKGEIAYDKKIYPEIREKDLKGHLEKQNKDENNDDIVSKTVNKKKEKDTDKNSNNSTDVNVNDYQLLRADDLINGINFYNKNNEENL